MAEKIGISFFFDLISKNTSDMEVTLIMEVTLPC